MNNKVIIISGNKGEGKTTKLQQLVGLMFMKKIDVAGFTAIADIRNEIRSSYTLLDVNSSKSSVICTNIKTDGYTKQGKFYFNPLAISFGENLLLANNKQPKVVVIDEVGPFELEGKVWHNMIEHHIKKTNNILLLTVRKMLVNEVVKKYKFDNVKVYGVNDSSNEIIKEIVHSLI